MLAGRMTEQVRIERFVEAARNAYNEPTGAWEAFVEPWAAIEVKRGKEHFENGQRFSEDVFRFTFRFDDVDGIDAKMRISWNGLTLDIKHLAPDYARRRETVVDATVQNAVQRP